MATTRFCLIGLPVSEDKTMFTGMLITIFTALTVAALLMPAQAQTTLVTLAGIQNRLSK